MPTFNNDGFLRKEPKPKDLRVIQLPFDSIKCVGTEYVFYISGKQCGRVNRDIIPKKTAQFFDSIAEYDIEKAN